MAEKTTMANPSSADSFIWTDSEVTYCSLSLISTKSIKFHQMWESCQSHVSADELLNKVSVLANPSTTAAPRAGHVHSSSHSLLLHTVTFNNADNCSYQWMKHSVGVNGSLK